MRIHAFKRHLWISAFLALACFSLPSLGQTQAPDSLEDIRAKAEAGDVKAQADLAVQYDEADDYSQAMVWARRAADKGEPRAQAIMAGLYFLGKGGVEKDKTQAVVWGRKAGEQGNSSGQLLLCLIYMNEEDGARQDPAQAAPWCRKAAEQGNSAAYMMLGNMYFSGKGVPQDAIQAYVWYSLASQKSTLKDAAGVFRDLASLQMTPAQLAEAKRMINEWKPRSAVEGSASAASYESALIGLGAKVTHEAQSLSKSASVPTTIPTPQTATGAKTPEHREDRAPEPHSSPQDRQSSPAPNPSNDFTWFWWVAGVIAFIMIIKLWSRASKRRKAAPRKLGRDRQGYQEVEAGVPHARFNRLSGGGFEVILKNENSAYRRDYAGPLKKRGFGKDNNHIVATKDALIINGKRLRNTECRGFGHAGFEANPKFTSPEHVLGYYYGTQFHEIPGVWSAGEAEEIVLSLNLHWRALFQTAPTSNQPDPEQLRNTRETDF